ncbi:unnamed protein product, partial [Trichogramma brassicae]
YRIDFCGSMRKSTEYGERNQIAQRRARSRRRCWRSTITTCRCIRGSHVVVRTRYTSQIQDYSVQATTRVCSFLSAYCHIHDLLCNRVDDDYRKRKPAYLDRVRRCDSSRDVFISNCITQALIIDIWSSTANFAERGIHRGKVLRPYNINSAESRADIKRKSGRRCPRALVSKIQLARERDSGCKRSGKCISPVPPSASLQCLYNGFTYIPGPGAKVMEHFGLGGLHGAREIAVGGKPGNLGSRPTRPECMEDAARARKRQRETKRRDFPKEGDIFRGSGCTASVTAEGPWARTRERKREREHKKMTNEKEKNERKARGVERSAESKSRDYIEEGEEEEEGKKRKRFNLTLAKCFSSLRAPLCTKAICLPTN